MISAFPLALTHSLFLARPLNLPGEMGKKEGCNSSPLSNWKKLPKNLEKCECNIRSDGGFYSEILPPLTFYEGKSAHEISIVHFFVTYNHHKPRHCSYTHTYHIPDPRMKLIWGSHPPRFLDFCQCSRTAEKRSGETLDFNNLSHER